MYFRNCPNCGREIEYKSQRGLTLGINKNSNCRKCKDKLCRAKKPEFYRTMQRNYDRNNPDVIRKKNIRYSKKHPEKLLEKSRRWNDKNPEKCRNKSIKSKYGITVEEYDNIKKLQDHKCAICKVNEIDTAFGKLCLDHCHNSDKIRGFLCKPCNIMLGFAKDNIQTLLSAAEYLQKNNPAETGLIDFDI
jgi:hypothetical protein